ncbi:MAG: trypsin-like serine protease [Nitrosomonas sp.]|nr:MAG: trypsin-like serine protease [Nitrosomonas sp.]
MRKTHILAFVPLLMFLMIVSSQAIANVQTGIDVTILKVPAQDLQSQMQSIDFENAVPMPLPQPPASLPDVAASAENISSSNALAGVSKGKDGSGKLNPMSIPKSKFAPSEESDDISSQEYGTYKHPFTTSRADARNNQTSRQYPFRASGKLYFNIGAATYVCSASLIKNGIIVTAAHCVAPYGGQSFYSNWVYVPAKDDNFVNNAPYGVYSASSAVVMTSWYNGSSGCSVVCPEDVALLRANVDPVTLKYPGQLTGYLGYGWDNWGVTSFAGLNAIQLTQLGYPVGLDYGGVMQRTDSLGYTLTASGWFNNTTIGSRQRGGSSGGPWIANFGIDPVATPDTPGSAANKNIIVGVTSWGYVSTGPKVQGASPFTSSNITVLVNTFCPGPGC